MVHIQKKKEVLRKKFAAAVTETVESSELFQGNDSYIQVPHAVENLLHTKHSLNFSIRRLTFYEILFLLSVKPVHSSLQLFKPYYSPIFTQQKRDI